MCVCVCVCVCVWCVSVHLARLSPRGHYPGLLGHHAQPVHCTVVRHRDVVKFGVVVQVLKNILEIQCPGMSTSHC